MPQSPTPEKFIEVPKVDPKVASVEMAPLRDVASPAPVSMRPQTVGWYVLGAVVVALFVWVVWRQARRWQAARYRREALAEVDALSDALTDAHSRPAALRALAAIVKRTQLAEERRPAVASLSGVAWRSHLEAAADRGHLPTEAATLLVEVSSARDERLARLAADDVSALVAAVRHWITAHHAGIR